MNYQLEAWELVEISRVPQNLWSLREAIGELSRRGVPSTARLRISEERGALRIGATWQAQLITPPQPVDALGSAIMEVLGGQEQAQ